jgi:hypothetical protein
MQMGLAMSESCWLWWNYLNLSLVERLEVAQTLEELQEELH